jgi:predicted RecB family nuclease
MATKKFAQTERDTLLAVKGVGPKVIERLEQLGIVKLRQLAMQDAKSICAAASALVGSTCWKNSPQVRAAIAGAIAAARSAVELSRDFEPARPEDVFGSLATAGRPKTLEEMDAGVLAEAKRRHLRD